MDPKKKMTEQECLEVLRKGNIGVLSMIADENQAYGVPLNYYYDAEDRCIYFHSGKNGKKMACLRKNQNVSFSVIGSAQIVEEEFTTYFESVIVNGRAEILEDEAEKVIRLRRLCDTVTPKGAARRDEVIEKYLAAVAVVRICAEEMTGKRNRDV